MGRGARQAQGAGRDVPAEGRLTTRTWRPASRRRSPPPAAVPGCRPAGGGAGPPERSYAAGRRPYGEAGGGLPRRSAFRGPSRRYRRSHRWGKDEAVRPRGLVRPAGGGARLDGSGNSHFLRLLGRVRPDREHEPVGDVVVAPVAHTGVARLGSRVRPGWFAQTHDTRGCSGARCSRSCTAATSIDPASRARRRRGCSTATSWPARRSRPSSRSRAVSSALQHPAARAVRRHPAAARRADRQPGPRLRRGVGGRSRRLRGDRRPDPRPLVRREFTATSCSARTGVLTSSTEPVGNAKAGLPGPVDRLWFTWCARSRAQVCPPTVTGPKVRAPLFEHLTERQDPLVRRRRARRAVRSRSVSTDTCAVEPTRLERHTPATTPSTRRTG